MADLPRTLSPSTLRWVARRHRMLANLPGRTEVGRAILERMAQDCDELAAEVERDRAQHKRGRSALADTQPMACAQCERQRESTGPTTRHDGSPRCKSGSIASGGHRAHCSCDICL